MTSRAAATRSVAAANLARYLRNDTGEVLFAYEQSYTGIAMACGDSCRAQGFDFIGVPVAQVNLLDLTEKLEKHPAVCLAFNRSYGSTPSLATAALVQAARQRTGLTWTLTDVSHRFDEIFTVDPDEIVARNATLREHARTWRHLSIRDSAGTELEIDLSPQYDWVSIDGFEERAAGLMVNLPPGEIATFPERVSGRIMFVGALLGTIPIGRKYGLIGEPLEVWMGGDSRADVRGAGALVDDVRFCFEISEHAGLVSEIGLGTHPAIRSLEGLNYSYEEKHYGFHIGFGAALAQQNVERIADHHLDLLFADAVIVADGVVVFDGNAFCVS